MLIDFQERVPRIEPNKFPGEFVLSVLEPAHLSFDRRTVPITSVEQVGHALYQKFSAFFHLDEKLFVRRYRAMHISDDNHCLEMKGKFILRGCWWADGPTLGGIFSEVQYELIFSGLACFHPDGDPARNYDRTQLSVGKPGQDPSFVVKLGEHTIRSPDSRFDRSVEPA